MKLNKLLILFLTFSSIISCSLDDSNEKNQERELSVIVQLKNEIEKIAATSVCSDNSECKYVAFGSKPCGGPWSYLVYSTSINEESFLQKVQQLNNLENLYNIEYGIISDCSAPAPPSSVECIDGVCTAIY